jgi:hypothetical protein
LQWPSETLSRTADSVFSFEGETGMTQHANTIDVPSTRTILLGCAIVASVLYVSTDIVAAIRYEGYSYLDQNYSELLATGAPTRSFMLVVSFIYNLLMAAFAIGVWQSSGPKRAGHIAAAMLGGYAIFSMVTPLFFQMNMRGTEGTWRSDLHAPLTLVLSVFILLSMAFGATLLGRRFRIYSIVTIVAVILFGAVTGLQVPELAAGESPPWMGFTERINIYATMLWFAVLASGLLQAEGAIALRRHAKPTVMPQRAR